MIRSFAALCLGALTVSGCDRGAEQIAQESAATSGKSAGAVARDFAGTQMPALSFTDAEGRSLDLAAQEGPVLLNLWATWCAPCVVEMPALDALAEQMQGRLRVITVSQDLRGAELVTPFFAEREFTHLEPWLDPQNTLAKQFKDGDLLPLTILFDAEGREVLRVQGGYEWDSEDALVLIEEALAESAS